MTSVGVRCSRLAVVLFLIGSVWPDHESVAQEPILRTPLPSAPPPGIPTRTRSTEEGGANPRSVGLASGPPGLTLYSIGDPTDEEQLYLQEINRARRDPSAEGVRLQTSTDSDVLRNYLGFEVDLDLMTNQLAALAPTPPLAMNARLLAAARAHSQDMLANAFQGHDGTDGSTFDKRVVAQGYNFLTVGENVFAHAHSVEEGHSGFEVDWGGDATTGGMQDPPHHRLNIHDPAFREVGIGLANGTNGDFGPQAVTQDFGVQQSATPFVTGVVYYDLNGNGSYDPGEGLGGVNVVVSGSQFYGVSANSGGYAVPVPGNGSYPVKLVVSGLADVQLNVTVANGNNAELNRAFVYSPPTVSGPDKPGVNQNNLYSFTPVPGATAYQWKQNTFKPATGTEGAESGLANVTAAVSSGYAVVDSAVIASGSHSFHLAHPGSSNSPPVNQFLTLNSTFRAKPTMQLSFSSRLGWATKQETARAQVSLDGGQNWQDVWTQAGTSTGGEGAFSTRSVSLASLAGKEVRLRFAYTVDGSFFPQTDPGVGWYLDNIGIQGADVLGGELVADVTGSTSFILVPSQVGSLSLSVRPKVSGKFLSWGPGKDVEAQVGAPPSPSIQITAARKQLDNHFAIDFTVTNPSTGTYGVQAAADPSGPWIEASGVTIQSLNANTALRALLPANPASREFFRVLVK